MSSSEAAFKAEIQPDLNGTKYNEPESMTDSGS
jgi:hypothetical protein